MYKTTNNNNNIGKQGRTIRRLCGQFKVRIVLQELGVAHPLPELTDIMNVTIAKRKGNLGTSKLAKARKTIMKMIAKCIRKFFLFTD